MTQEQMNILVPEKLKEIENKYDVKVLWAIESGSRAWGFASPDSDFDVRFIYKRKPEAYLRLERCRDVIELPVDDTWDVSGWDIDKTIKLLRNTNPTLYEWMNSPIRYIESDFSVRLAPLMKECFTEDRMLYHYSSIAKSTVHNHLQKETVKPKKYFYALRSVLACEWIRQFHSAPPVPFSELYETVLPDKLKTTVDSLLELKRNGPEGLEIPPVKNIDEFLDEQISGAESYLKNIEHGIKADWNILNEFFVNEINGA